MGLGPFFKLLLVSILVPFVSAPICSIEAQTPPSADEPQATEVDLKLKPRSNQPMNFDFPQPTSVTEMYQALAAAGDFNVLFHPELRDRSLTVQLTAVPPDRILDIITRLAGHFVKVLDEHTVLILADTPQNRRQHEDVVIRTFFLDNTGAKDVITVLRSLVDARTITANEALSAVTLRDTAAKVRLAEEIIATYDKRGTEVVLQVELLAIDTGELRELGRGFAAARTPDTAAPGDPGIPLRINQEELAQIRSAVGARSLASPRISVVEGKKVELTLSDLVPIPTTRPATSEGSDSSRDASTIVNYQYQDVGLELEVAVKVHPRSNEVTLDFALSARSLADPAVAKGEPPVIGGRSLQSQLRLNDGETCLLSGLLRTTQISRPQRNRSEPMRQDGLISLVGFLFGDRGGDPTEIVVALTPHVTHRARVTESDRRPLRVGTESQLGLPGRTR